MFTTKNLVFPVPQMAWFVLWECFFSCFAQNSFTNLPTCSARIYAPSYFTSPAGYANSDPELQSINKELYKPPSGDLICHFDWNWINRREMMESVRERIKYRQKVFVRFTAPIYILHNASCEWQDSQELQTWIWVTETYEYMLRYPHNFVMLSLGTLGIITKDYGAPDKHNLILGACDKSCIGSHSGTKKCSLTWQDVQHFMSNVTERMTSLDWGLVCLQLDYDVKNVIKHPQFTIPDTWYYWRFLRQYFSRRPSSYLGNDTSAEDFIHYRCYDKNGEVHEKELMRKYYVILIIAFILWLYLPLLLYYFPSSKSSPSLCYPNGLASEDFHPSYKSPKCFGIFLRCVFCFYMKHNKGCKARLRRVVFFVCFSLISFRLLPIPGSPYSSHMSPLFLLFLVALLVPDFLSVHLKQEFPKKFLDLWEYPDQVFRETSKKEYQFLAHCMKERIYLITDSRFWDMLWSKGFQLLPYEAPHLKKNEGLLRYLQWIVLSLPGVLCFVVLLLIYFVYYFAPTFYFYKELLLAIGIGLKSYVSQNQHSLLSITQSGVYGVVLTLMLTYIIVTMFFWCYLFAEVIMFTYIGVVLLPSMAFKYIALVAAVVIFFYKTANDMRENYDRLRDQVLEMLQKPASLEKAFLKTAQPSTIKRVSEPDGSFQIVIEKNSTSKKVLHHEDNITYLSRDLFDACIESCDPVRRQVCYIVVIAVLMLFYILIAMWVKNVFHKEKEVSSIFIIAQTTATYFIPNLLQFLAHRSHFIKNDALVKQSVRKAIVEYANRI